MATKEAPSENAEKYAYEATPDGVVMRRHLTLDTIPAEDLEELLGLAEQADKNYQDVYLMSRGDTATLTDYTEPLSSDS